MSFLLTPVFAQEVARRLADRVPPVLRVLFRPAGLGVFGVIGLK